MMRTRNILMVMAALVVGGLGVTSCSLSVNLARSGVASYTDDLYGVHDTQALREAERLLAEKQAAAKAETERCIAAMVAKSNAEADIDDILGDLDVVESPAGTVVATNGGGGVNVTYNTIYVDDYASAYARRLQGFSSLTYRMPASYWDYRYGDAYFLTLAYDPAFYTVMVMGDQVWVEPRYITNMFGSWNNPYYYGYRYGYNPYYYGYSYGYWDYWGWNSPYWGCDPFWHYHYHWYAPHYGHHHHHHPSYHPTHRPGGPGGHHGGGHREHNVTHRPSYGISAGGSTSRPSYNDRLGGSSLRGGSRGGTQIAVGSNRGTRGESSAVGSGTTSLRGDNRGSVGSSARPSTVVGGRPAGGTTGRVTAPTKGELSSTLSGTTITAKPATPTRGGGVSGSSNSSSRSSRSATTTRSSSSSSSRSSGSVSSSSSSRSSSRSSSSVSRSSSSSSSRGGGYSSGSSSRSGSSNSSSRSSRR